MRILFIALLVIFFISLIFRHSEETYQSTSFWDFLLNYTAIIGKSRDTADTQTDTFLKELKNKKEDLDYLQNQIDSLRTGLKEMPDKNQNGYFRDLLKKFEGKESVLNQQLAQMDQNYQEKMQNASPQEAQQASQLREQNQEAFQQQATRMNALMESNQMRAEAQMERLNDLMAQNRMYLEALIERTNNILQQRQNPINPDKFLKSKYSQ